MAAWIALRYGDVNVGSDTPTECDCVPDRQGRTASQQGEAWRTTSILRT